MHCTTAPAGEQQGRMALPENSSWDAGTIRTSPSCTVSEPVKNPPRIRNDVTCDSASRKSS
eukprot:3308440-Rhodomonas_salina.6